MGNTARQEVEQLLVAVTPFLAEVDHQQPGLAPRVATELLEKGGIRLGLMDYIRVGQLTELAVRFGYGLAHYDATCSARREIAFDWETGPALSDESKRLLNKVAMLMAARAGFTEDVALRLNPLLTLAVVIGYATAGQEE